MNTDNFGVINKAYVSKLAAALNVRPGDFIHESTEVYTEENKGVRLLTKPGRWLQVYQSHHKQDEKGSTLIDENNRPVIDEDRSGWYWVRLWSGRVERRQAESLAEFRATLDEFEPFEDFVDGVAYGLN